MAETPHPEAEAKTDAEGSSQATPKKDRKLIYEVSFHIVPTVAEGDVAAAAHTLHAAIENAGGSVIAEEAPKRMRLAYRIERSDSGKREKYTESYFGWVKFEGERDGLPQNIPVLQETLRGTRDILRFLLIETVREAPAPARAVFSSDRLEGETIAAPKRAAEKGGAVSEEELQKGIESLIG